MKMKICIITTSYPRYKGDFAGNFIHNLAKGLVKEGVRVSVVAPHDVNTKNHDTIDDVEIYRFQYWFTKKGQKVAYGGGMPDNIANSFLAKIQLLFFMFFFFLNGLKVAKKCDLIHAQFLLSGFIGVFIKKLTKKSLIITARGSDVNSIPSKKSFQRIILKSLNSAGIIICVSSGIKNKLENLSVPENKLVVIPNGVDLITFSENHFRNQENTLRTIVWVGRMVEVKGLQYLFKSLQIVKNNVPDGKLILVGDGPLREKLVILSRELKIEEMVSFVGYVEHKKIPDYLHKSIALVVSSTNEGFPNVIYEAMAMSLPVISTKIGGIQDIIKDRYNGFLVEPKNPEQLAEKIIYLLENPAIAKAMGRNGKDTILKLGLTWKNTAKRTIEIYKNLLRENR